ncbi:MAG: ribonuclease D [Pseudomonadota bacterium]
MMNTANTIQYVDTAKKLEQLCQRLESCSWLALDTEFLREKTYYPKFCLLQIAVPGTVACIDPLALESLGPLFDLLYNPGITKVFHAGRQDMEIFYNLRGTLPAPVFDTQIAAPLLGLPEQPGYGALVSELLKTNLSKAHTRTDWCHRPLSEAQLRYAADDVIYLGRIYQAMKKQLDALERTQWLEEDFNNLANPEMYKNAPEEAWRKVRGANKLSGVQLAILQALAQWREQTAQTQDRPRNWLLKDESLFDLARLKPETPDELEKIRGLNDRTLKRFGAQICKLIGKAKHERPISPGEKDRPPRKSPEQEAVLDLLNAVVRLRAVRNAINPAVLASRKDLEMLLLKKPESKLFHGWRYSMVGKELESILQGKRILALHDGELSVRDSHPAPSTQRH